VTKIASPLSVHQITAEIYKLRILPLQIERHGIYVLALLSVARKLIAIRGLLSARDMISDK
jgi:hypothetical protein